MTIAKFTKLLSYVVEGRRLSPDRVSGIECGNRERGGWRPTQSGLAQIDRVGTVWEMQTSTSRDKVAADMWSPAFVTFVVERRASFSSAIFCGRLAFPEIAIKDITSKMAASEKIREAAYGTWESPISADLVSNSVIRFDAVNVHVGLFKREG